MESGNLLEPNVIEHVFCLEKYALKKKRLSFCIQLIRETLFFSPKQLIVNKGTV